MKVWMTVRRFEVQVVHLPGQSAPDNLLDAKVRLNGFAPPSSIKGGVGWCAFLCPGLDFVTPDRARQSIRFRGPSALRFPASSSRPPRKRNTASRPGKPWTLNRPKGFFLHPGRNRRVVGQDSRRRRHQNRGSLDVVGFAQTGNYTPV